MFVLFVEISFFHLFCSNIISFACTFLSTSSFNPLSPFLFSLLTIRNNHRSYILWETSESISFLTHTHTKCASFLIKFAFRVKQSMLPIVAIYLNRLFLTFFSTKSKFLFLFLFLSSFHSLA